MTYHTQGEGNGRAIVDEADVRKIRRMYATGMYLQKELAEMFGIHQTTVSKIIRRQIWST